MSTTTNVVEGRSKVGRTRTRTRAWTEGVDEDEDEGRGRGRRAWRNGGRGGTEGGRTIGFGKTACVLEGCSGSWVVLSPTHVPFFPFIIEKGNKKVSYRG